MIGWAELRREPFRVLFPLGVLSGCLGVGHWLCYALGWSASSSAFYHASLQMGSYLFCFILGFLLTALPRFSNTAPSSSAELLTVLVLILAQPVLLSIGRWVLAEMCFAGLLVTLAWFAGRRFATRRSQVGPPAEFVWILIALLHGLLGTALLIAGQMGARPVWMVAMGRPMVQQGYVLAVVIGVGGFLAFRFMGRKVSPLNLAGLTAEQAHWIRCRKLWVHGIAGILLLVSFWIEGAGAIRSAYVMRAGVVTAAFAWLTQWYRPPAVPDRYVWLVWLSLWMIVLGLWGVGVAPRFRVAMLHLVFLGGFSLMTFAVGTMVVLSHAGEARQLRQPLWIFRVVGLGIAVAVIARLVADLAPTVYFPSLGVAAGSWLIVGVSWLAFVLPRVVRASAGTFEQVHEEAKQRLLRMADASRPRSSTPRKTWGEGHFHSDDSVIP